MSSSCYLESCQKEENQQMAVEQQVQTCLQQGACWNGYRQKAEESSLKLYYPWEDHPQKEQCLNRSQKSHPLLGRLTLGRPRCRAFLHRHGDVCHLHSFLPTYGIVTGMPEPPLLLLNPLKYSKPTLIPSVCQHRLSEQKQPRVGRNNCTKSIKRNERKPEAAQQLLLK